MKSSSWYILIGCVIVLAVSLTGYYIHVGKQSEKERTLISELVQLRSAIALYKATYKEIPEDLTTALDANYPFNMPVWTIKIDSKIGAVDPFGNPYKYDSVTGWVQSRTTGFEKW